MNSNRHQPLLVLVTIAFILVASSPAPGQIIDRTPKNQLDKDLDVASSLIRIGDFERALSFMSYIVKTHGRNYKVISLYKLLYSEAKMYQELEKLICEQLAENPGNPQLLAELANVRFLLNDRGAADSLWNLALDEAGPNRTVYMYVANYKLRYGDYDGAAEALIRGRANFGDRSIFAAQLADIYESKREYSMATHEYLVELSQNPKELSAISARIQGYLEDTDNPDEIIATVRSGINEFPESQSIQQVLGNLYIQKGEMRKALETYRTLGRERRDDGASLYRFAERCYDSRAYATTITAIDEYLRISGSAAFKEPALLLKGKAQRAAGIIDEALATLVSLSMSAANPEIRDTSGYLVGVIFAVDLDDCRQAVANWKNLIQQISTPDIENEVRVEMASCLFKMEKTELAESLLTQVAVNRKPDEKSERALFLLGELAFFKCDYDRAREIYTALARQHPGGCFANNALERLIIISAEKIGDGYSRYLDRFAAGAKMQASGHPLEAAGIFSDSIFYFSSIGEQAEFNAALAYGEAGQKQLAIESFKSYISTYPDGFYTDRAYLSLGDLYMENAETLSLARSAYNMILEAFPEGPVTEPARERLKRIEASDEIG